MAKLPLPTGPDAITSPVPNPDGEEDNEQSATAANNNGMLRSSKPSPQKSAQNDMNKQGKEKDKKTSEEERKKKIEMGVELAKQAGKSGAAGPQGVVLANAVDVGDKLTGGAVSKQIASKIDQNLSDSQKDLIDKGPSLGG